jgi:hypothetical protein
VSSCKGRYTLFFILSFLPCYRMSMEFNTVSPGVTQPSPENCDEKGNQPVTGLQPKRRKKYEWELKRVEDLEISDFFMYDDDIKPFMFMCGRFTYKNKAQILHCSAVPIDLTDDLCLELTPLCKFVLDKYNAENQVQQITRIIIYMHIRLFELIFLLI